MWIPYNLSSFCLILYFLDVSALGWWLSMHPFLKVKDCKMMRHFHWKSIYSMYFMQLLYIQKKRKHQHFKDFDHFHSILQNQLIISPSWNNIVRGHLSKLIEKYQNSSNIDGDSFKNAYNFLNIEDSQENP